MGFANFGSSARVLRYTRKVADWPLAYRIALFVLPAGVLFGLVAGWGGYHAVSASLMESLRNLPMLEARTQAASMEETLKDLRHSLFRIAQSRLISERQLRESIDLLFQENASLIQEIGFTGLNNNGFLLLRDEGGFQAFSLAETMRSPYSPFQQINALPLQPGEATLYPAVYFDGPTAQDAKQTRRSPVIRMALLLPDGSGTVIIGVSVAAWCDRLGKALRPDSGLRLPSQEDAAQLAFYFDLRGWILFEMDGSGGAGRYQPDRARHGYSGDLGRPGYDAAFRPWTIHENYWLMVTEVMAGRSGSIPAPSDKYAAAQVGATGTVCFAPVLFSPTETAPAAPAGAIAFFETSFLPLSAFLTMANYSLGILVAAVLFFGLLIRQMNKMLIRPFRSMANELAGMAEKDELAFLSGESPSQEHQKFQGAINALISTAMITRNDLERISREMQRTRSRQPVDLQQSLETPPAEAEFGLVGSSVLIREVRDHVHKAAKAGTDVLIWGETGTGKELVAAAIHKAGPRGSGPYISINCGALDENLLLDTLFGHVKGAFTEAKTDRKGAFLSANGGTLHLDEIANASSKVQQALLRALSVRRIRPLGSDEELSFNTRVVASTNVDLRECVRAGTFREDLYYRLAIISIETPPLRHRKDDIPELAAFCIHEAAQSLGRHEARLSRGALDLMCAHDWPGNVREFKNCITRAMAFVEGNIILPQHITLERDAYSVYADPLSPRILAERLHPSLDRASVSVFSPRVPMGQGPRRSAADKAELFDRVGAPAGQGAVRPLGYASEQLWPAPSRELFTPAKQGQSSSFVGQALDPSLPEPPAPTGREKGTAAPARFSPASAFEEEKENDFARVNSSAPSEAASGNGASSGHAAGLNERQVHALLLVREQGAFTRAQYEAAIGQELSSRTAQNDLRDMVERGILERVGAGPGTRYTLQASLNATAKR